MTATERVRRGVAEAVTLPPALLRAGVWRSASPARLFRVGLALRHWRQSMAVLGAVAAIRFPDRDLLVDDRGALTHREADHWIGGIAAGLRAEYGISSGSRVAVLCRNHRYFLGATLAASRLGADVLFVNTEFAPPQLAAVLERHQPDLLVHDEEFAVATDLRCLVGWSDHGTSDLDRLAATDAPAIPAPTRVGHVTLLTSGTTGAPKAAPRTPTALNLAGLAGTAMQRYGLRSGEPMVVCPPLFHGLGLLHAMLALFLGCPLVLARKFDPAAVLASVDAQRAGSVLAVPVMLQRMLDLGPQALAAYDLTSLRAVVSGAAALPPTLAARFVEQFGPVLSDAYGSSEIGIASVATSADLLAAPGTVGRPCLGGSVRILGPDDRPLPTGVTGRIFAGGGLVFGGYSDGSTKVVVDGRMGTGDLGHLDAAGRLFVDGREDDMIVSGGENVYPNEVEDCLLGHPAVAEAVVLGVPDEEFGQRLVAYVVPRAELSVADLLDHARARLSRYQLPRDVTVVDSLPRTATGKVLKRELPGH